MFTEPYQGQYREGGRNLQLRLPARGGHKKIVILGPKFIGLGATAILGTTGRSQ